MEINRRTALEVLLEVETEGAYSNLSLNRNIKKTGAGDPAFVRELVYGVLKKKYLLDHFLRQFVKKGFGRLKAPELNLLRMGAYQLLYMGSVPSYAAISETVELAKKYARGKEGFINGVLRSLDRKRDSLEYPEDDESPEYIGTFYSVNPWIARLLIRTYGYEDAKAFMEKVNSTPELSLRVNLLKNTREELMAELSEEGFRLRASELSPRAVIAEGSGILETEAFRMGRFSVQDQASIMAADSLMADKGMRVIDLCAAPGGKTAAIAEAMENTGEILAFDIYDHKLELMDRLMERNGISIVNTRKNDGRVQIEALRGTADRVLCDVPCSGLGVLGRKPELKYRDEYDMRELAGIQSEILKNAASYLKEGGILVYSTCTVDPDENQGVTERFLEENREYRKDKELSLAPHTTGTDGFYICRIIREA